MRCHCDAFLLALLRRSRTLALVKPDAYPHLGKIIAEVRIAERNDFTATANVSTSTVEFGGSEHSDTFRSQVYKMGFVISKMKMVKLSKEEVRFLRSSISKVTFS